MPTILVVDDSPVDRRLAGGLLEKTRGLKIEFASDGVEAMERIRVSVPDVVLTDLIMPKMDGLELVAQVSANFPRVPIILMTGKGSEEIAVQALQAGAASYVPKALLAQYLEETIENLLAVSQEELSHQRMLACMKKCRFEFVMECDETMIAPLVNHLNRAIRSLGLCDESHLLRVCVALEEALNNALYHGNLELSSDMRENDPAGYRQQVELRSSSSPYNQRKIYVDAEISPQEGRFVIRDEGPGFDPNGLPDPTDPANLEKASGRGLLLMRTFMDEILFNDSGNQVTLVKRRSVDTDR